MKEWVKNLELVKKKAIALDYDSDDVDLALESCEPLLSEVKFLRKYRKHNGSTQCTEASLQEFMNKAKDQWINKMG